MRFLFKALLAATALLPVAAVADAQNAQNAPRERGERTRGERGDARATPDEPRRLDVDRDMARGGDWNANRDGSPARPDRRADARVDARADAGRGDGTGFANGAGDPVAGGRDRIDGYGRAPRDGGGRYDSPRGGDARDARPAGWASRGGRDARAGWRDGRDRNDSGWRDDRRFDGPRGYASGGGYAGGYGGSYGGAYDRGDVRQGGWRNDDRGNDGRNWNRGWRTESRYDWGRYRTANRGAYRLPRYYAPQGWRNGYRRYSVGVTLDAILFDRNYWIADPYAYRLPDAYGPYRWVRYFNDALLVDVRYGRVVDVVNDIFW